MIPSTDIRTIISKPGLRRVCLLDARSPGEFEQGHIPGAINIPLLDNEERRVIGITYKEKGHDAAVRKGFELTGHKFAQHIDLATEFFPTKEIITYCWRGGLRSNIMSWILQLAGFNVTLISGGYKTYRNWVLQTITEQKEVWVLGGQTGCGKTEVLQSLLASGQQVVDLESLAHHKGSTFGALGQLPQPTQEQFENNLAPVWSSLDPAKPTWVEEESRWIGRIKIPDAIYDQIASTQHLVRIDRALEQRKQRILSEYGHFPIEQLSERTALLEKRLGGQRTQEALSFLEQKNLSAWVDIMLDYYDHSYGHAASRKKLPVTKSLDISHLDIATITRELLSITEPV